MDREVRWWMNIDLPVMMTPSVVALSFEINWHITDHHSFLTDVDFYLEMVT